MNKSDKKGTMFGGCFSVGGDCCFLSKKRKKKVEGTHDLIEMALTLFHNLF